MQTRPIHPLWSAIAAAFVLAVVPSCGGGTKHDANNREIAWTYGPTSGTARSEHLIATGTKGPGALAKGWKCRLSDGRTLTVRPYELAESHALFDKVTMIVTLFEANGDELESFHSEAITATNATFAFEITAAAAGSLHDVVIWFKDV